MQGQEYLNQISATNRPVKQSKKGNFLTSKYFMIGAGVLVALIIIMIIGAALSGNKGGEKNNCLKLYLHLSNTTELIDKYQNDVKSSKLRGSSASLKGVLTNTNKELVNYMTEKYKFKEKEVDKKLAEEATTQKDALDQELFEAKINGSLDRIFAHKMAYEISLIETETTAVIKTTNNDVIRGVLEESYKSLENLYNEFNDFSETK